MIRKVVSRVARMAMVFLALSSLWIMPAARAEVPPQLEKIQAEVEVLQGYVDAQEPEWLEVQSYIHGPMGRFRIQLGNIQRKMTKGQLAATADDFKELPDLMNALDEAAGNYSINRLRSTQSKIRVALDNISAQF